MNGINQKRTFLQLLLHDTEHSYSMKIEHTPVMQSIDIGELRTA